MKLFTRPLMWLIRLIPRYRMVSAIEVSRDEVRVLRSAYDPREDQRKILNGEIESYFD